jgi:hypothetical protein
MVSEDSPEGDAREGRRHPVSCNAGERYTGGSTTRVRVRTGRSARAGRGSPERLQTGDHCVRYGAGPVTPPTIRPTDSLDFMCQ